MNFQNKVVLVTGAASGIGAATAKAFMKHGARLAVCDRHGAELKKMFEGANEDQALLVEADVSREKDVRNFVKKSVEHFGQLDVVVNNAGIYHEGNVTDHSYEQWSEVLRTDLDGVFLIARETLPELRKTKGCMINISSASGMGGDKEAPAYNAAKGAVTNLTRAMAIDDAENGVRINAICPTFTRTGLTEDMLKDKELVQEFLKRIPMKRIGEPQDIANAALLLASEEAGFITGVNLPVDGGLSASNGQPM